MLHLHLCTVPLRVPAPAHALPSLRVPIIFCPVLVSILTIPIFLPSQQALVSQKAAVVSSDISDMP